MQPKIKITDFTSDFLCRQFTTPNFRQIGDQLQTPPLDLGESLKKTLLRSRKVHHLLPVCFLTPNYSWNKIADHQLVIIWCSKLLWRKGLTHKSQPKPRPLPERESAILKLTQFKGLCGLDPWPLTLDPWSLRVFKSFKIAHISVALPTNLANWLCVNNKIPPMPSRA